MMNEEERPDDWALREPLAVSDPTNPGAPEMVASVEVSEPGRGPFGLESGSRHTLKPFDERKGRKRAERAVLKFASDLADFAHVDWPAQENQIEEDLGDLLIRLDEFQHLLAMSQSDTATCLFQQVPAIAQRFPDVERIFQKIDRLELMVSKIKINVDNIDKILTQAENSVVGSGIRTFMPMLFGAARPPQAATFVQSLTSTPPSDIPIFSTEEFYPKN